MKLSRILALLFITSFLIGCSNDDDDKVDDFSTDLSKQQLLGTWRISYFWDQTERTLEFSDYRFTFDQEDEIRVTVNTITAYGDFFLFQDSIDNENYSILETSYGYVSQSQPVEDLLMELTEEWLVKRVNSDATIIEFEEHISDNPPEIMHLTKVQN